MPEDPKKKKPASQRDRDLVSPLSNEAVGETGMEVGSEEHRREASKYLQDHPEKVGRWPFDTPRPTAKFGDDRDVDDPRSYLTAARDQVKAEKAPKTPEEASAAADREFDDMHQQRLAQLASEIPESNEVLNPSDIETLDQYADRLLRSITGGEVELGPAPVQDGMRQIPPVLYAKLKAIEQAAKAGKAPSLKGQEFSAQDAAMNNSSLRDAAAFFDEIGGAEPFIPQRSASATKSTKIAPGTPPDPDAPNEEWTGPLSNEAVRDRQQFESAASARDRKSPLSNEAVKENEDSRSFMRSYDDAKAGYDYQPPSTKKANPSAHDYANARAVEQDRERRKLKEKK